MSHLTKKQVNAKPQSFWLMKTLPPSSCWTFEPWGGRRNTQAKPMAKCREKCPAKTLNPKTKTKKQRLHKSQHIWRQWRKKTAWLNTKKQQESDSKRMIQRLSEESGQQENTVLSTWKWCKQGWLHLSQRTDHWPRPCSLLLTVINNNVIIIFYLTLFKQYKNWKQSFWRPD